MKRAKVCILGEVSVGKTSLVRRFVDRAFSDDYLSTVGVKISRKLVHITVPGSDREDELQLILWDLEGGHTWLEVSSTYLKGASGAIIVGDLTRPSTLREIQGYIDRFKEINPDGNIVVALNKIDVQRDRHAGTDDEHFEGANLLATILTSARTGKGVDELFMTLGAHLLRNTGNGPHA
jgi:small GTP-binding protein